MDHKSWENYRTGSPLEAAQRLANRGSYVGSTIAQSDREIASPLTGQTLQFDDGIELGSLDWCMNLAQKIVDTGPDGYALSFVEDVAVEDDADPEDLKLVEKPGFVTFFIKTGVF